MGVSLFGRRNRILIIGLLLAVILAACSNTPAATQPAVAADSQVVTEAVPTDTPQPTPTLAPARVVLLTAGMDESLRTQISTTLAELTAQDDLTVQEQTDLAAGAVQPDWRLVIAYGASDELNQAVSANPAVQFIIFTDQVLASENNLSVIRVRRDKQAFLAGYVSTIMTNDWRVGGLFTQDAEGDLQEQAFINGGEYFCGLCNPYYAPLVLFPVSGRVSGGADSSAWQAEVDSLLGKILYTVYVSPGSQSDALLDTLAQRGVMLVGTVNPPDAMKERWGASILLDAAAPLREMWPAVLAGKGGHSAETSVVVANINEDYVTVGKQRLIENVIHELDGGWLDPMDPAE